MLKIILSSSLVILLIIGTSIFSDTSQINLENIKVEVDSLDTIYSTSILTTNNPKDSTPIDSSLKSITTTNQCNTTTSNIDSNELNQKSSIFSSTNISLITAIILLLTVIISYLSFENATRPLIKFTIDFPYRPWRFYPIIENLSKTDAEVLIFFTLRFNNENKIHLNDKDGGAYNGKWLWYVPAKNKINGNTSIQDTFFDITKHHFLSSEQTLFLEVYLFYTRMRSENIISKIMKKIYLKKYNSPIYKWQLQDNKWVFVPAHKNKIIRPKFDISPLKQ